MTSSTPLFGGTFDVRYRHFSSASWPAWQPTLGSYLANTSVAAPGVAWNDTSVKPASASQER
jgi:hypothetical protein